MCCIITHESGANLPELASFENAMLANRDGCGIAYMTDQDKIRIRKWIQNPEPEDVRTFIESLGVGVPWVFHARLATHGSVDAANTHPYQLNRVAALAHNGIIRGYGSQAISDTRDFIKRHKLGDLSIRDWSDDATLESIGKLIPGSKFAVLVAGKIQIVNRKLGEELHTGCWTSNEQGLPDYEPFAYAKYWGDWRSNDCLPARTNHGGWDGGKWDSTDFDTFTFVREQECGPMTYTHWRELSDDDKAEAIELAWELSAMAKWLKGRGYTR